MKAKLTSVRSACVTSNTSMLITMLECENYVGRSFDLTVLFCNAISVATGALGKYHKETKKFNNFELL
ncbi:hypothetical protein QQG55_49015 [Brugia pahangi]